ncbi:MAG TPA: molybdopterin-dependent oxidoreductase, partial [Candidatus Kryptonia bacterium]|nr:molybdopterin-dependent oxidoreductase [Candidatus Kryptonia bacterium]
MTHTQSVDPSVSRTPLPLDGNDLATVCVLCSHNCGLRVDVKDGRISDVRADDASPITHGYVCNKAFAVPSYVEHAQRVQFPLRRQADGSFEHITWDVAISEIAAKLDQIRTQHSPRAIALVGVGGQANHMNGPFAIGFLRGLGSRKWFNAFAQEKTQHNLMDQWMFNASPAAWLHADAERTRFMLVLGTNPKISNRGHNATDTFKQFSDDRSRTLVVVDPRETETTRTATRHLRVRPGTDAYLLLAVAAVIVERNLVDGAFIRDHTTDFETLRVALSAVDVDEMASRCGVAREAIIETATGFATAESASIFYDLGVEQTPFSTLISYLIRVLLTLTGNLGHAGGNVFMETFAPAVLDPARVSEPERALASGIPAIRAIGNFGMMSPTLVPEEVMVDHPQRLRALIVEGSNPFLSYSDTSAWRAAREQLDLLVVIEPAMTETARLADYVLPTPVGYEKWEFAGFPKRYPQVDVQLRPPVVPGPAEALPEPEIYVRLAEAMNLFGAPPAQLHDLAAGALEPNGAMVFLGALQQLAAEQPRGHDPSNQMLFWAYRTLGPQLPAPSLAAFWMVSHLNAMMRGDGVVRALGSEWQGKNPFEIAAELFRRILAHPEGVEIARVATETNLVDHLGFDDKRVRLAPAPMLKELARAVATPPTRDRDYPFVLAAGLRTRWTANTIQRDPGWRKGRGPHCALNLSPNDA